MTATERPARRQLSEDSAALLTAVETPLRRRDQMSAASIRREPHLLDAPHVPSLASVRKTMRFRRWPARCGRTALVAVGLVQPHSRDLSTSTSQPGEDGSKPCSTSQRTARRLRNDHYARITSSSTSVPRRQGAPRVRASRMRGRTGIALARLGPVDHAGDFVTVDEHVGDLQVAVDEHRCPRRSAASAIRRLRVTKSAGRTSLATSHSHSPSRRDASSSRLRPGHGGSGASCSVRTAAPAAAHAAGDAVDGSPR